MIIEFKSCTECNLETTCASFIAEENIGELFTVELCESCLTNALEKIIQAKCK